MKHKAKVLFILHVCLAAAGLFLVLGIPALFPGRSPWLTLCTGEGAVLLFIGGRYLLNLAVTAYYNRPEKAEQLAQMEEYSHADQDERREALRDKASRLAFIIAAFLAWAAVPVLFMLEEMGILEHTLEIAVGLLAFMIVQIVLSGLCFFWLDKCS